MIQPYRTRHPLPKRRSKPRRGVIKDPAYLTFIASQPCCVCVAWQKRAGVEGSLQLTKTEVAHVGSRGLGQKCSDWEAIPLCEKHHRTGPLAQHKLGKLFWQYHGVDREKIIAEMNQLYESQKQTGS